MSDYNGWANYETWAFHLHLSNNQADQEQVFDWLAELDGDVYALADTLKAYLEDVRFMIQDGQDIGSEAKMMVFDVGSHWRVEYEDVAKAFKESWEDING